MTPEEILAYLRFLRKRVDALLGEGGIGVQELSPLQSEIRIFRERLREVAYLGPTLRESLISLDIEIPAGLLIGSKEHFYRTWWTHLPIIRILARDYRRAKDWEKVSGRLLKLRDQLEDSHTLASLTFQIA